MLLSRDSAALRRIRQSLAIAAAAGGNVVRYLARVAGGAVGVRGASRAGCARDLTLVDRSVCGLSLCFDAGAFDERATPFKAGLAQALLSTASGSAQ